MSRNNKRTNSVKYGICTNMEPKQDGTMCSLCKKKEKQAIRSTKDFVCAECGTPLTEVTPPRPFPTKLLITILSVILLIVAVVIGIMSQKENGENEVIPYDTADSIGEERPPMESLPSNDTIRDTVWVNDTTLVVVHDTIVDTVTIEVPVVAGGKKATAIVKNGTYNLGWGTYSGPMKNGKPDDGVFGEIKVIKEYRIDLKDGRGGSLDVKRGDVIVNPKFKDGKWMIQGELHRTDGTRRVL